MAKKSRAKETAPIKLILGGGLIYAASDKPVVEGFTYVEAVDLDFKPIKLKYKDNSVDEIQCQQILQYLTSKQRIEVMDEIWRVLKVGCKANISTPFWSSALSVFDPLYQWPPICENSYLFYNKAWRTQAKRFNYPIKCNFECPGNYGYSGIDGDLSGRNQEFVEQAVKHQINSVTDLSVVLTKLE